MSTQRLVYPKTRRDDVSEDYHGTTIKDPYRWLEDQDSKDTADWVKQQNEVTDQVYKDITTVTPFLDQLKKFHNYPKLSLPFKRGNNWFVYKNTGLQNQNVLYIAKDWKNIDDAEVFLDPNTLSEDGTAALSSVDFSRDGKYMSYQVSLSGSDWNTIYIKNVETRETLTDKLEWIKFASTVWTWDHKGFFYTRWPVPSSLKEGKDSAPADKKGTETDENANPMIYYHLVGTSQAEDKLIYHEPEHPKWFLGLDMTDEGRWLIISASPGTQHVNTFWYIDLHNPVIDGNGLHVPVKVLNDMEEERGHVANNGTVFYLQISSEKFPRKKLVRFEIDKPEKGYVDIIPQHEKDVIQGIYCKGDLFFVNVLQDVKDVIYYTDMDGKHQGNLELPVGTVSLSGSRREQMEFFVSYTGFLKNSSMYHFDIATRALKHWRDVGPVGLEVDDLETIQVFYTSKDGAKIPMFIVKSKNCVLNGENPTLLYGYGGFNISLQPSFSIARILFLRNFNGIFAMANLRGGGEYGEEWHLAGCGPKKQNVFDDFQYAARYLIENKYTTSSRLAIMGGSNGGTLVNACINQAPELFGCAVSQVPVTDMLRFKKFTIGYAWVQDFGNPDASDEFPFILKYSPLHNVRKEEGKQYPALLITTADHDDRVVPAHSFKMISELQHQLGEVESQKNPLIVRIEVKGGHGAGKPLWKALQETAETYAFIAKYTGATWKD